MKRTLRGLAALSVLTVAGMAGVATRTHAQTLTTGTVAGTVTDASGKKLSGVQITITDTGQMDVTNASGYYVITDVLPGTHTVEASLVGYQPAEATNVVVTQELTTTVNLQLTQRAVTETGVTRVVAPLIHKSVTPTLYTVTSHDEQLVRSQPNNLYQYPGAMISQPGVVPDSQGYPSIRGSKNDQINFMVDGISISEPLTNTFGTNLVTVGMDRMNVYTGGYRAELGAAIGGVVNSVVKTGASMRGAAVEASTGSWDYSGLVYEQGNVEKNGFNWYVSGNFWRTRFEKNLQIAELPVSVDTVAKFILPVGKDRLTILGTTGQEHYNLPIDDPRTGLPWLATPANPTAGYQSKHFVTWSPSRGFVLQNPVGDYDAQGYGIGSLTYAHQMSSSSTLSAQIYRYSNHTTFNELSPWNGYYQRRGNGQTAGKLDWSNQLSQAMQLRVGGEYNYTRPTMEIVAPVYYSRNPVTYLSEDIYTLQNRLVNQHVRDANAYLATTLKPNDQITIDAGVRYDSRRYDRLVDASYLQANDSNDPRFPLLAADLEDLAKSGEHPTLHKATPRVGITYAATPRTVFKASAGQFIQMPSSLQVERKFSNIQDTAGFWDWWLGGSPDMYNGSYNNNYFKKVFDVKPQVSDSYDVGIEQQFGNTFGLAVTPFYRKVKDETIYAADPRGFVPAYTDDQGNDIPAHYTFSSYQSIGHGHVRGVETKLTMRETRGLSGWITYTLQSAKDNNTASITGQGIDILNPQEEHRVDYDQKHTIYVVAQYVKGNFEINPMLELGSGYPYGGQAGNAGGGLYATSAAYVDPTTHKRIPLPILVNGKLQSLTVNPYNTGWHRNLSVTFRLYTNKQKSSYYFLQIQNLTNSKDVTARTIYDPQTGTLVGIVPGTVTYTNENGQQATAPASVQYQPYTRIPPVFVLLGVRQSF